MPSPISHAEICAFLARPQTYGLAAGQQVDIVETHISVVFLAGQRAFKLKKPVVFPYLDHSARSQRLAACRTELEVNRRFSPQLYLGLGAVRAAPGGLVLCAPPDEIDWETEEITEPLVVMRRFASEAQLDHVAQRSGVDAPLADRLGQMVADIVRLAPRRSCPWPDILRDIIDESLDELAGIPAVFDRDDVVEMHRLLRDSIDAQRRLLHSRAAAGLVRRCHGDLHLRNIAFIEGRPVPFDALEFDEALATTDVQYELAFLIMDLLHLGLEEAAARVLSVAVTQMDDFAGVALLPVYAALRAIIRCKVGASSLPQRPQARQEVKTYWALAKRLLRPVPARLVAIGGLSGSGKTTCAFALAPRLGPFAVVIRSDVVRKRHLGLDIFEAAPAQSYVPSVSTEIYDKMFEAARAVLAAGLPVVLDGVFADRSERDKCTALAKEFGLPFHGIWLEAGLPDRQARIGVRTEDASDADAEVARRQIDHVTGAMHWERIDAGGGARETARKVADAVSS